MLIGSLLQPTSGTLGDYWYCYADRELYWFVPSASGNTMMYWQKVDRVPLTSHGPPLKSTPGITIYIEANDKNNVPRMLSNTAPIGTAWIPIVDANFPFPPLNPKAGDLWQEPNTLEYFMWNPTHPPSWVNVSSINFTSSSPVPALQANTTPAQLVLPGSFSHSILEISGVVRINYDGTIEYAPGYHPDDAAKAFWEAIVDFLPNNEKELAELKAKVRQAEMAGFTFVDTNKKSDPTAAWNAAMEII